MGSLNPPQPVLRLVPIVSRYDEALAWARERVAAEWGELALVSDAFIFNDTDYYDDEMGTGLKKQFVVTTPLMDPATLPDVKVATNGWEAEYAQQAGHPERRPLNLDPGYIAESKLVLASTKKPLAPHLSVPRHLRRDYTRLRPQHRLAGDALELPRLPTGRFSGVFHRMPAATAEVTTRAAPRRRDTHCLTPRVVPS